MKPFRLLQMTLLALCAAGTTPAGAFTQFWQMQELIRTDGEQVELRNEKGRIIKRVEMQQMLYLYAALQAMLKAGEIEAEMIIVDGEHPNAFATRARATEVEAPQTPDGEKKTAVVGKSIVEEGGERRARGDEITEAGVEIGVLGINFAMLDMLQLDVHMMAALIGHELAHLKLKHGEESERQAPRDMQTAANTRYSRDNEREADYLGAIWAVEAGYDPEGAVRLQEMIYKSSRFAGGGFSGSHPTSTERIAILKSLARRLSTQ